MPLTTYFKLIQIKIKNHKKMSVALFKNLCPKKNTRITLINCSACQEGFPALFNEKCNKFAFKIAHLNYSPQLPRIQHVRPKIAHFLVKLLVNEISSFLSWPLKILL